jgi:hypothetical protein
MLTELIVDWVKHSFITKFNGISPNVYQKFKQSLMRDILGYRIFDGSLVQKMQVNGNRSLSVAKRIGFHSIPISCLLIRVSLQIITNAGFMQDAMAGESIEDESYNMVNWKLYSWVHKVRMLKMDTTITWLKESFLSILGFVFAFLL